MNIILSLTPETVRSLQTRANQEGCSVENVLQSIVERDVGGNDPGERDTPGDSEPLPDEDATLTYSSVPLEQVSTFEARVVPSGEILPLPYPLDEAPE